VTKLSKEELLDYFDSMCLFLANHHWTKRDERAVAIKELLQKPEVTEEFIEEWADILADPHEGKEPSEIKDLLKQMLKEAGVHVS